MLQKSRPAVPSPLLRWLAVCAVLAASCLVAGEAAAAAPTMTPEAKHDVSPALRSIPVDKNKALNSTRREHRVKKLPPLQNAGPKKSLLMPMKVQSKAAKSLAVAGIRDFTGIGVGFKGVGGASYAIASDPPDTNGAVGKTQYVQWVNTAFAVLDKKTGAPVWGPTDGKTLWKGFGGNCETFNDGDPIVQYDKLANRWIMTQFAVSNPPKYSQCVAVSTTDDATGPYARYEFQFTDFNDYPKFGVWPDGYYATFNMFDGDNFVGGKACAFERDKMLAGKPARMQCFDVPALGGLLPADFDGSPPPAGTPNYILALGPQADSMSLWRFHVDWADPSKTTSGDPTVISVSPFQGACDCVPQRGTTEKLSTLGDRLMYRLAYRRMNNRDVLLANHSVLGPGNVVSLRWYEIDPAGSAKIVQGGTYTPDGLHRWIGSIAMDKAGDMAIGYSVSSKTMFPSIRFTGRSPADPPGTLAVEKKLVDGKGAQVSPDRWGDYSSMTVDPEDDCTFWFTSQVTQPGQFVWSTSISSFRFQNCQ